MGSVVVGVDGSGGAEAALDEAIKEAKLRRLPLRLVCAWRMPAELFGAGGLALASDTATRDAFREVAERVVAEAVARARECGADCQGEAVEGQAALVLVKEAESASLIVVGRRGRGGFSSLLLGSVSQHVVHHANCPVLVVRGAAGS